jgi:hypothetical protein
MRAHYTWDAGRRRMLFLVTYGRPWVEFGQFLLGRVQASGDYEQMEAALRKFFSQTQRMVKRSSLHV